MCAVERKKVAKSSSNPTKSIKARLTPTSALPSAASPKANLIASFTTEATVKPKAPGTAATGKARASRKKKNVFDHIDDTLLDTDGFPGGRGIQRTTATAVYENVPNLNLRLNNGPVRAKGVDVPGAGRVYFDDIPRHIMAALSGVAYVVGCVAWFTHKEIISVISQMKGASVIVANDKSTLRPSLIKLYSTITPLLRADGSAVRVMGTKASKSMMHHKFLVGLNETKQPAVVLFGSFNMSELATCNIENIFISSNATLAKAFYDEYVRVHDASKAITEPKPTRSRKATKQ